MKPRLYIKSDYNTFELFCRKFTAVYQEMDEKMSIENDAMGPSSDEEILAIMYLHLILESLITFCTRNIVEQFSSATLRKMWKRLEYSQLEYKLNFLEDLSNSANKTFIEVKKFANKSSGNRNLIVHGHELSETHGPNHYSSSKLKDLLDYFDIEEYKKEFLMCIEHSFQLMNEISSIHGRKNNNLKDVIKSIEYGFRTSFLPQNPTLASIFF